MGFKRRDFVSSSLRLGTGLTLLGAAGCSDSGSNFVPFDAGDDQPEISSTVRLHFDLGDVGDLPGPLSVGTGGKRFPVYSHDESSLSDYPGLDEPTHYADIDPPEKVILAWIIHHHPDYSNGQHDWVHLRLLIPPPAGSSASAKTAVRTAASCSAVTDLSSSSGPQDIAMALVFHHPELMSLDAEEASAVACHLLSLPEITEVEQKIRELGRASEDGGWATLKPIEKDNPDNDDDLYFTVTRSDGSTERIYQIVISEELDPSLQAFLQKALNIVKSDSSLPNKRYATVAQAPDATSAAASRSGIPRRPLVEAMDSHGFDIDTDYPAGSYQHGIEWLDISVEDVAERKLRIEMRNHSFRFFSLYAEFLDAEGNTVEVEGIRTDWEQYFFPQAELIPEELTKYLESSGVKYLRSLGAVPTILGVPLTGEGIKDIAFVRMPDEATSVRFLLGSAGATGHWPSGDTVAVPIIGMAATIVAQFLIPAVLLALSLGVDDTLDLFKLFAGPAVFTAITLLVSLDILAWGALYDEASGSPDVATNAEVRGQNLLNTLLGDLEILAGQVAKVMILAPIVAGPLAEWFGEEVTEEETADCLPFFGVAYRLVTLAATAATIGQTATQLHSNPPMSTNSVSISQRVTVDINHDLDDFQFPATATHYEITLQIEKGETRSSGRLALPATTSSNTLSYTFDKVPSGGDIRVTVLFYADGAGGIVGSGHAARYHITEATLDAARQEYNNPSLPLPLPGIPEDVYNKLVPLIGFGYIDTPSLVSALNNTLGEDDASTYRKHIALRTADDNIGNYLRSDGSYSAECTIQERLITLTANSSYQHKQQLALESEQRVWQAGAAGTGTLFDLSQGTSDGDVSELGNLSLNQRTGQCVYNWRSAAASFPECGSAVGSVQLSQIQTVSLTQNPQSGWHRALTQGVDCGQADSMAAVFELLGSTSGDGNNFAVSSEVDENGLTRHFARRISAATDGSIELGGDQVVGEFILPPTSLTVHPAGYLVATNAPNHKLQVLPLPADKTASVSRDRAPKAQVYGGRGSLPGMLAGPVVVRASLRGNLYVMETLNRRVQVLNSFGQPKKLGDLLTASTISLESTGDDVTLLDMGVDAAEFLYILGYTGNGGSPNDFILDVYDNTGVRLFRSSGVNAGHMTVDLWRNIYTVNYERLLLADGRAEPSISLWIPFTPA